MQHAPRVHPAPEVSALRCRDDLIFDIGMNTCEDTDFYLRKGFRVVAVEANPSACADAEIPYAAQVASGQLTILNRAVSDTRGPLRFYVCRTASAWSTASTTLRDWWIQQGAVFDEIEVEGIRSSDLFLEFGVPRYAKIDIEGYDLVCLQGFQSAGAAPRFVSAEVDFYTVGRLLALLQDMGYRRFALIGQRTIPEQKLFREVSKEGLPIDYAFQIGCSGLFGEDLPVNWATASDVRRQCDQVVRQHRLSGALGKLRGVPLLGRVASNWRDANLSLANDWYDIHAAM